jgi:hypothetical protein
MTYTGKNPEVQAVVAKFPYLFNLSGRMGDLPLVWFYLPIKLLVRKHIFFYSLFTDCPFSE